MTFLYPEFFYALPALAIPVIVHLFNFRRARKVYFPSTRFLRQIQESSSRKRRLKHYLILAARLLFLAFLILAFAQPFIPSADKELQAENVYIYLDNSPSMSVAIGDGPSGLSQGLGYISGLLSMYPGNTNYRFVTNEFAAFSHVFKTKGEMEDLLTEIHTSNISRSLEEAYSRLRGGSPTGSGRPADVYIISDFQKSTLGDPAGLSPDSVDRIILAPIPLRQPGNILIDTVYLSNPFSLAAERNQINAVLRNTGDEDRTGLQLRLYVNETLSANASVDIPAGARSAAVFDLNFRLDSLNTCRIDFEDYPVAFDNEFHFVLKMEDPLAVLELKNTDSLTAVGRVFANPALFRLQSQNIRNPDYSLIRQSDLVVLNGLPRLEPSLLDAFRQYLGQGGHLMIFPSAQPEESDLRMLTGAPVVFRERETAEPVSMPDPANPFFRHVFESTEGNFDLPQARNNLTWTADQGSLLQLRDGTRFLSVFRPSGTVYLLGAPLADGYTNFHRHALFVPVMYRAAALSRSSSGQLYFPIQDPRIRLPLDSVGRKEVFRLRRPEGELIPDQRIVGSELQLEVQKNLLDPGFYELLAGEQPLTALAFNRDKRESYLEQYTSEELKELFSLMENVAIFEAGEDEDFLKEIRAIKLGVPLWKYAVALALLFLLLEVLIIRFVHI
jgi:hypothetical protein